MEICLILDNSYGFLLQMIKLFSHLIPQTVWYKPIKKGLIKLIPSYLRKTKMFSTNK